MTSSDHPKRLPSDAEAELAKRVSQARHDLRNPLAHILGFSEILIEKTNQRRLDTIQARLEWIETSASELLEATNHELDVATMRSRQSDMRKLQKKLQDVATRIAQTADSLKTEAPVQDDEMFSGDLELIAGAARQLRAIATARLTFLLPETPGDAV